MNLIIESGIEQKIRIQEADLNKCNPRIWAEIKGRIRAANHMNGIGAVGFRGEIMPAQWAGGAPADAGA